ncbi:MAG: hypothetical protein IPK68_11085 [Bdellovibrionales bacterium]|nr:hypothetical protein [Bdellovibrionales bacterium]
MGYLTEAQADWYMLATNPELKNLLDADIKGKQLYGSIDNENLKPFRDYFEKWILKTSRIFFAFTSQDYIKLNSKTSYGRIKFSMKDGTMRYAGDELQPILSFIKGAANDLGVGPQNVEVVVDESEQNSYGLATPGAVKSTEEFSEFNTLHGGLPSKVHCPSAFRITITPDQSPNFQHALLFPDVACYLANKYGLLNEGKAKVDQDLFHIRTISADKILEAAIKWRSEMRPS